jgi:hypothetical protein
VYAGRFYPAGVQGRMARLLEKLMVKRLGAVPGIARYSSQTSAWPTG